MKRARGHRNGKGKATLLACSLILLVATACPRACHERTTSKPVGSADEQGKPGPQDPDRDGKDPVRAGTSRPGPTRENVGEDTAGIDTQSPSQATNAPEVARTEGVSAEQAATSINRDQGTRPGTRQDLKTSREAPPVKIPQPRAPPQTSASPGEGSSTSEPSENLVQEKGFWLTQSSGSGKEAKPQSTAGDSLSKTDQHTSPPGASAPQGSDSQGDRPPESCLHLTPVPSSRDLRVGEVVTIEVVASSPARVVEAPFHLAYDPTLLRFLDASAGDFLSQDAGGIIFLANGQTRAGDVVIGIGRTNRSRGVTGRGTLCRVRFLGAAPGAAIVRIPQAMAWADSRAALPVLSETAHIDVHQ